VSVCEYESVRERVCVCVCVCVRVYIPHLASPPHPCKH
jgi:hypothetical protein